MITIRSLRYIVMSVLVCLAVACRADVDPLYTEGFAYEDRPVIVCREVEVDPYTLLSKP